MIDILNLMWIIPFCLCVGFIFGETSAEWNRKKAEIMKENLQKWYRKEGFLLENDKNSSVVDIFLFLYLKCFGFYGIFLVSKTNVFLRQTGGLPYERGQKLLYRR